MEHVDPLNGRKIEAVIARCMRDYSLAMIIAIFVIALLTNQMLMIQLNVATVFFKENAKRLAMMIPAIM